MSTGLFYVTRLAKFPTDPTITSKMWDAEIAGAENAVVQIRVFIDTLAA